MLHKEIPFLRIGLPLCIGIISGLYFKPDNIFLLITGTIIISGFLFSLAFNNYQPNQVFGYTLTLSLLITGLLLYSNEKKSLSTLKPEKTIFICTLSDYPEEKENSYRLVVKLNRKIESNRSESLKGSILLYNKKDLSTASMLPGDLLIIRCTPVEITNRGNPYEFDYRFFMENQGIRYYAFTNNQDIIRHTIPIRRKLIHRALIVREKIIRMFEERGIKGERLALVSAITLGQKSMLDPEQKLNFIKAGVMHIMAVSGLHAIILSLFVFNLLFFMKRKFNIIRIIITILILWSFAFVTGLTPSVLRATLMFSFLQAGKLMKRPSNSINSVLASAFFLIIIRPSVIFDAGFLLSYSAVIFIISFYHNLYTVLHFRNWLTDKIWQSAAVTIVAQAGTLPLTILLFNRFPTYFMLANITIVPVSNLLIITGCLVPMFFQIQFLSRFLAMLLNYLTGLTELLTYHTASLPYSTIENIGSTTLECILLSATIFLFIHFLLKKKSFPVFYPVFFLILFVLTGTARELSSKGTNEIIVYNTPGTSTIGIRTGKILYLFSDSSATVPEVKRHCATLGLRVKSILLKNKYYCIKAKGKQILIANFLNKKIIQNFSPDILVLTGYKPEIENDLNMNHFPSTVIISSQASSAFRVPQQVSFTGIDTLHFVRKSGAFIRRI
ncbi:MAG: ComEC/Rec2 family competence protein [Bacteroidales bacterium]